LTLTKLFFIGEVISECYELEYGTDCLEMHVGAVEPGERALIIDDLVATGGTLSAAIRLLGKFALNSAITVLLHNPPPKKNLLALVKSMLKSVFGCLLERVEAEVVECACVIGLPEVKVIVLI